MVDKIEAQELQTWAASLFGTATLTENSIESRSIMHAKVAVMRVSGRVSNPDM